MPLLLMCCIVCMYVRMVLAVAAVHRVCLGMALFGGNGGVGEHEVTRSTGLAAGLDVLHYCKVQ